MFMCPNGHQLTAPEDRAGKPGKCPKCQTEFLIPSLDEIDADDDPTTADTKIASNVVEPSAPTIAFLCPNGHKLTGPASLRGKPGQCPHCGAKFPIPAEDDDEAKSEPAKSDSSLLKRSQAGSDVARGKAAAPPSPVSPPPATGAPPSSTAPPGTTPASRPSAATPSPTNNSDVRHALLAILEQLWHTNGKSSRIELRVGDETITATHYAANLSGESHGVFAVKEANGTFSVTAIPWDSITRLTVHNVDHLKENALR